MARPRGGWGLWLRAPVFLAAFAAVMAATAYALHATLSASPEGLGHRDAVYFGIHAAGLGAALVVGAVAGAVSRAPAAATGLAFLVAALAVFMLAQVGSYELACGGGHNDLIRHWTC